MMEDFHNKTNMELYEKELLRKRIQNIEGEESDEECCCRCCTDEKECECLNEKEKATTDVLKQVGWFVGETVLISGICAVGVSFLPGLLGFRAGGIAARSCAALYQSRFLGGTIAKGSMFSLMQRAGVKGIATATKAMVGTGVAGAYQAASTLWQKSDKKENKSLSYSILGNKKECKCKRSQMKHKIGSQ